MLAIRTLIAVAAASTFAATAPTPVSAQSPDSSASALAAGARVRFALLDPGSRGADWASRRMIVRGKLTDLRTDSLVLELGGNAGRLIVARSALADLSVSRGTQRGYQAHPKRAAIGAVLAGANIGLLAYASSLSTSGSSRSIWPLMAASTSLSTVSFLKFAFGRTEKWEAVK